MKLKGGGYVDPDSHLEDKAHVLKIKDTLYSAVLGAVDIASGKNSYYKIQVLSHFSIGYPFWGSAKAHFSMINMDKLKDISNLDTLRF